MAPGHSLELTLTTRRSGHQLWGHLCRPDGYAPLPLHPFPLSRGWRLSLTAATAIVLALAAVLLLRGGGAQATDRAQTTTAATTTVQATRTTALSPAGVQSVRVGRALAVRPVASGFLGLSLEYYAIEWYLGADPQAPDPVFLALLRNLAPGGSINLRIGGDSADWLWLSTPGVKKGVALKVTINARTIQMLSVMTKALNAKLIVDLDLEDNSLKLADNIARTITAAVGASHVEALELGNEPDLYDVLAWYTTAAGTPVLGRPAPYTVADYTQQFNQFAATLGNAPLAGPATSKAWNAELAPFVAQAKRLQVMTMHEYPLETCGTHPGLASYPTIAKLLTPSSTLGIATSLLPNLKLAHAAGKPLRIDEINSVSCFGAKGVSDTYAAALWALETSLQFARLGYDGLNFTTVPSAFYRLFVLADTGGTWGGQVLPEYYGLLAFADTVPPGSRFLDTPDTGANPQVFALKTPSGQIRVIAVNTGAARKVALSIPGATGPAVVTYLRGPSLSATGGVSLAGQSFGARTTTGELTGRPTGTAITPVHGVAVVALPAHSAAILSVQ